MLLLFDVVRVFKLFLLNDFTPVQAFAMDFMALVVLNFISATSSNFNPTFTVRRESIIIARGIF